MHEDTPARIAPRRRVRGGPRIRGAVLAAALAAMAALAACGGVPAPPESQPSSPATPRATGSAPAEATPSPTAAARRFEFMIVNGVADPPLERVSVERGTAVRIVVASDRPDELHLHGYDLRAEVGPDREAVLELRLAEAGLFELELHDSGLVLLQLAVQ